MKVIIRVKTPQLKHFLRPNRIERLPVFSRYTRSSRKRHVAPLTVWARSIATAIACLCFAMVASFESAALTTLSNVGESLVERVQQAASAEPEVPRPPAASFPYGSVPPLQSTQAPVMATR
jgi:hypothetical protein